MSIYVENVRSCVAVSPLQFRLPSPLPAVFIPCIFDQVQVRGDITNSHIHNNYYGVYTFGDQDGVWTGNEVDHNVGYGFDPHDDTDNLLIENNEVHHNGNHGIIASKRCDHVIVRN